MSQLRVVVMCCDGLYQRHLLRRVSDTFELVGVVLQESAKPRGRTRDRLMRYRNPMQLFRYLQSRILLPRYEKRSQALKRELFFRDGHPPTLPVGVPYLATTNINDDAAVAFLRRTAPDVVLVNGTQLLRAPILELLPAIRYGIVNLHTGLSPYSRGGNCNLYMLLEKRPECVGVTVHHIDAGIDSGDIILSAQVPMEPDDCFEMIDDRSFHLGIELLLSAVQRLEEGSAKRVAQWEEGKLFLRRTGYVYEPWHRLAVNRLLDRGLVREYLAEKVVRDVGIRVVGQVPI